MRRFEYIELARSGGRWTRATWLFVHPDYSRSRNVTSWWRLKQWKAGVAASITCQSGISARQHAKTTRSPLLQVFLSSIIDQPPFLIPHSGEETLLHLSLVSRSRLSARDTRQPGKPASRLAVRSGLEWLCFTGGLWNWSLSVSRSAPSLYKDGTRRPETASFSPSFHHLLRRHFVSTWTCHSLGFKSLIPPLLKTIACITRYCRYCLALQRWLGWWRRLHKCVPLSLLSIIA